MTPDSKFDPAVHPGNRTGEFPGGDSGGTARMSPEMSAGRRPADGDGRSGPMAIGATGTTQDTGTLGTLGTNGTTGTTGAGPAGEGPARQPRQGEVKEQVRGIWDYARSSAESALSSQQHAAASGLQDFASALRGAGDQLAQQQKQGGADLAHRAADTLEHVSATLHGKDLRGMAGDIERFARRQPVAFIGTAVALGFLGMRFIKSSSQDSQASALRSANPGLDSRNLH